MVACSRPVDSQIIGMSEHAKYLQMLRKIYRCDDLGQIFAQLNLQLRQQAAYIISESSPSDQAAKRFIALSAAARS